LLKRRILVKKKKEQEEKEIKEREKLSQENILQIQIEKEKTEQERYQIKNKMRLDKEEVEQNRRLQRERELNSSLGPKSLSSSNSFTKKKACNWRRWKTCMGRR